MAAKKLSILTELTLNAAGFDKGADGAKSKFAALKQGSETAASGIKGAFSNMAEMFTPMTAQLGGLQSGVLSGVKSFKAMVPAITGVKTAFIATGIGAIVIALATAFAGLVAWVKRTDEGSDSLRKVFDVIKAVINTILDKLAALGSAIVKLFKGDFKGAGEDAKRAFTGWGDAISDNIEKAKKLNDIQDKLEDFQETAALKRAEVEERISELAMKARDEENYNAQQRMSFAKQLRAAYGDLYKVNKEGFDLELAALKQEQSTNANNQEIRQKINEKMAEGIRLSAEYNNNVTSTTKLYNKTRNEIAAAIEEQKKLAAEQLKAMKKADMEGVSNKPLALNFTKNDNSSNIVATLTARQNKYNESIKNTQNHWKNITKELKGFVVSAESVNNALGGMSEAFQGLFSGSADGLKKFLSSFIDATIGVIQGYLAQAIAAQIASNSKAGLPGLIAAGVGVAAVKGLFSSLVPKFQMGGIVPGNSYYGDRVPVLANSGEMYLNGGQQANLFRMLNGGGTTGGNSRLVTKVSGRDLMIILERESKYISRGR
jgi:hypothetical protein